MEKLTSKQILTTATAGILFWLIFESVFMGFLGALMVFAMYTEPDDEQE